MNIEVDLRCSECGQTLNGVVAMFDDEIQIQVCPCPKCFPGTDDGSTRAVEDHKPPALGFYERAMLERDKK